MKLIVVTPSLDKCTVAANASAESLSILQA